MKLSKFLRLTTQEENLLKQILLLNELQEKSHRPDLGNELTHLIIDSPDDVLLKLALVNSQVNIILHSSELHHYWEELWQQCDLKPHETVSIKITSHLDLLKGLYVYQGYCSFVKDREKSVELYFHAAEYLKRSAELGCFFAFNILCTEVFSFFLQIGFDKKIAMEILHSANNAARIHWTPGYLLLANVCQELTLYADELFQSKEMSLSDKKKKLYLNALEAIYTAQYLENHSQNMIHNAYQKKSIWQAFDGKYQNWLQMKIKLQNDSGGLIQLSDFDFVSHNAKQTVKKLIPQHHLSCTETEKSQLPNTGMLRN